ncbi:hypothetical protein H8356DRAFT_1712050 [Neocallimastix lanati (nom. inval.)]|nr:hypothetical protein H8356DRAFT_1712050 [Neocallimastix sp. JGI-2020a]
MIYFIIAYFIFIIMPNTTIAALNIVLSKSQRRFFGVNPLSFVILQLLFITSNII